MMRLAPSDADSILEALLGRSWPKIRAALILALVSAITWGSGPISHRGRVIACRAFDYEARAAQRYGADLLRSIVEATAPAVVTPPTTTTLPPIPPLYPDC